MPLPVFNNNKLMAQRKIQFINGEIYHIILRGVDGRLVFMGEEDNWRGVFSLYEFNNILPVTIRRQRQLRKQIKKKIISGKIIDFDETDKRNKPVEILSFVFMPNHIHLLLRQIKTNGVSIFMQKFGSGYTSFVNTKYQRVGHLFQGKFEAKHISGNEYLKNVFVYIHANPLSIIKSGWKELGIDDVPAAIKFLEEYRWSSYLDYLGKNNFPSLTDRQFLLDIFGGVPEIKKHVESWVAYKKN